MILTGRADYQDGFTREDMMKEITIFIKDNLPSEAKFIFMYENQTKCGTPCKEHLHFFVVFPYDKNPETLKKKWRAKLTERGFSKTLASLKVEKEENRDLAINYTCKQQNVFYTNYNEDEKNKLLLQSKVYNESIKNKVNNDYKKWQTHKIIIMEKIEEHLHANKITFMTRQQIITFIVNYTFNFHRENPDYKFVLPTTDKLKPFINYIEQELFSEELNIQLRIADASVFAFNKQLINIYENAYAKEDYKKRDVHSKPKKSIQQLLDEEESESDSE